MTSAEKVVLIEEQMKTIQKKWVELKTEVNNLDRKRRKARKKEREGKKNNLFYFLPLWSLATKYMMLIYKIILFIKQWRSKLLQALTPPEII